MMSAKPGGACACFQQRTLSLLSYGEEHEEQEKVVKQSRTVFFVGCVPAVIDSKINVVLFEGRDK